MVNSIAMTSIEEQFVSWIPTAAKLKEVKFSLNELNISIYFQRVYDHNLYTKSEGGLPRTVPIAHKMNICSDNPQIREIFEKYFPKSGLRPNYHALNGPKWKFELRFFKDKQALDEKMHEEKLQYEPKERSCGRLCIDVCFIS
jgi:hypothetical protein